MNWSILISIISTVISVFVLYRTVLQERFSLQVDVRYFIENHSHTKEFNRLYVAITFVNRSKLPVSINSAKLSLTSDYFEGSKTYNASFIPLKMYSYYSSDAPENKLTIYSDAVPINLTMLSSSSVILGFPMPDYFVRRAQYDNPILVLETSRKNIEVPINLKSEENSIDISKWTGHE